MVKADATKASDNTVYNATLFVRGAFKLSTDSHLWLTVISEDSSTETRQPVDVATFRSGPYKVNDPNKSGTNFEGQIALPANLVPGRASRAPRM